MPVGSTAGTFGAREQVHEMRIAEVNDIASVASELAKGYARAATR
jgi:hypothetical protein